MINIVSIDTNSQHSEDFVYDFPEGFNTWLMLLTHTPAVFRVNGIENTYPADCLILFKPFSPLYYRACTSSYSDDWMHFNVENNVINESLFLLGHPIHTPLREQCASIFALLATENYLDNECKAVTIHSLVNVLLDKLLEAQHLQGISPRNPALIELRKNIYKSPGTNWTLDYMAQHTFMSKSHLQALYKKMFHISCINDVINSRIQLSKNLLLYTDYTISYISLHCGYNSPQHFFRQFNSIVGVPPNRYRLTNRKGNIGEHRETLPES